MAKFNQQPTLASRRSALSAKEQFAELFCGWNGEQCDFSDEECGCFLRTQARKSETPSMTPTPKPALEIVWPEPDTLNKEAAPAYAYSDKQNLATRALTSLMSEKRFYESATESDSELLRLFESVAETDPNFVKGLLLMLRKDFHMRSVSHVFAAELTRYQLPETADLIAEICERPDDMLEILSYYTAKYGDSKLPNSLKKGLAKAFRKFNEYQLAKYNKKKKVWLRDILRIAHPKPDNPAQAALWGRVVKDTLKTPDTWETKISKEGASKENWGEMIDSGKMGYMATLKNLRNFLKHDVSMEQIKKVAAILSNPERVKKSKQLPFRFFSAYRALKSAIGVKTPSKHGHGYSYSEVPETIESVSHVKAEVLFDALEEAARHSAANMPQLEGTTAIACDVSASMEAPISEKSTVEQFDIGLIMGALANGFSRDAITGIFGSTWKEIELDGTKPLASTFEMHRREGEVGYATHGYQVIKTLLEERRKVDRILFFTDCQMYGGDPEGGHQRDPWQRGSYERGNSIGHYIREYRRQINSDLKLYFFDMSGYGTCVVPESDPQTMIVGGWSEKLFDLIPSFEAGDQHAFLRSISDRYEQWQAKREAKGKSIKKPTRKIRREWKATQTPA